jgi:hypothetical protein
MAEEIVLKVILTLVGFVTTGALGYLTAKVKEHKKRDTQQQLALMCLLRSTITSKYYVYKEIGSIPYYEKENIDKLHEQYKSMGGNSYVDIIVDDLNKLPIKK